MEFCTFFTTYFQTCFTPFLWLSCFCSFVCLPNNQIIVNEDHRLWGPKLICIWSQQQLCRKTGRRVKDLWGEFMLSCFRGGRAWSLHAWINPIKSALAFFSPAPSHPYTSVPLPLSPCNTTPPSPFLQPPPTPLYNSIWPGHTAHWHIVGQKGRNDELLPVGVIHDDNY